MGPVYAWLLDSRQAFENWPVVLFQMWKIP
jgi:hypothetical protein